MMNIRPIKNELDYTATLKRIDLIWDAVPGTAKGDEFEVLSILIEHYEQEHYAIAPPDPVDAIKFRMEQMGMNKKDLAAVVGGRNRSTEILSRKRGLSVSMLRNLHNMLKVPAESLLSMKVKVGKTFAIQQKAQAKIKKIRRSSKIGDIISPVILSGTNQFGRRNLKDARTPLVKSTKRRPK